MAADRLELASIRDLFLYELQGMYYIEQELVAELDDMASNATDEEVQEAFATHRDETREHVNRVDQVFDVVGEQRIMRESPVMKGLKQERQDVEERMTDDALRDLYYLGAGVKTERIEMSGYNTLIVLANKLDLSSNVDDLLQDNLNNERKTLTQLRTLATGSRLKALLNKLRP